MAYKEVVENMDVSDEEIAEVLGILHANSVDLEIIEENAIDAGLNWRRPRGLTQG